MFACADLANVQINLVSPNISDDYDTWKSTTHFLVEFCSADDAVKLASRSVLIKSVVEIIAESSSWESLINCIYKEEIDWSFLSNKKFSYEFDTHNMPHWTEQEKKEMLEQLHKLEFPSTAKVCASKPDETLLIMGKDGWRAIGRVVALGGWLRMAHQYSLKRRSYLGTTSMDAELAAIMSNLSLIKSGSLCIDPFCGTGGVLVLAAAAGAHVLGGELDTRVIAGENTGRIADNMRQYDLSSRLVSIIRHDMAWKVSAWRENAIFDAVVCDPPYGVRAGSRKFAGKKGTKKKQRSYSFFEVERDLLVYAARVLRVGGRLVYWVPQFWDKEDERDKCVMPSIHPLFHVVADCDQGLTTMRRRRLITAVKTGEYKNDSMHGMSSVSLFEWGNSEHESHFDDGLLGQTKRRHEIVVEYSIRKKRRQLEKIEKQQQSDRSKRKK